MFEDDNYWEDTISILLKFVKLELAILNRGLVFESEEQENIYKENKLNKLLALEMFFEKFKEVVGSNPSTPII